MLVCETESEASSVTIPVIDISLLSPEDELQKLKSVLSSCGCFQAISHGMSVGYLDKVREVAKQFFALPNEEKQKCSQSSNEVEGYGDDFVMTENQIRDSCYRLFLRVFPEDQTRLDLWPENPSDFSEIFHEYAPKVQSMMKDLYKAMARSLKLEENSFLNQFGDRPTMHVRFNFYPSCSRSEVFGMRPHSDISGITVVLQEKEVEGLLVLKDGAWYTVPVIPHGPVVILCDLMLVKLWILHSRSIPLLSCLRHRILHSSKQYEECIESYIN